MQINPLGVIIYVTIIGGIFAGGIIYLKRHWEYLKEGRPIVILVLLAICVAIRVGNYAGEISNDVATWILLVITPVIGYLSFRYYTEVGADSKTDSKS